MNSRPWTSGGLDFSNEAKKHRAGRHQKRVPGFESHFCHLLIVCLQADHVRFYPENNAYPTSLCKNENKLCWLSP